MKTIRDYINLIESAQTPVMEGSIGDLIKFKKPFIHDGKPYLYAQISGFSIDPNKQGTGAVSPHPFLGASAHGVNVNLKRTPYSDGNYYGKVTAPIGSFDDVTIDKLHNELQLFKKIYGFPKKDDVLDYSKMLDSQGVEEASTINGQVQDPGSQVWKLTSMSAEEARAKYGSNRVRVKSGGLRSGGDAVEVLVSLG